MKVLIGPSNQIIFACSLLPIFSEDKLKLESCFYISADNNTNNLNHPINLPWKLQLELVNRSINKTVLFRKRQKIAYIPSLNQGLEELKVKYTKT